MSWIYHQASFHQKMRWPLPLLPILVSEQQVTNPTNLGPLAVVFLFGTHSNKYEHTKASDPCKSMQIHANPLKFASWCWKVSQCSPVGWQVYRLHSKFKGADLIARCYNFLLALKSWSSSSQFRAKGQIGEQFERRLGGCNKQVFLKNFDTLLTLNYNMILEFFFSFFPLTFVRLGRCKAGTCLDSPSREGLELWLSQRPWAGFQNPRWTLNARRKPWGEAIFCLGNGALNHWELAKDPESKVLDLQ